jgi:hypothetical protein
MLFGRREVAGDDTGCDPGTGPHSGETGGRLGVRGVVGPGQVGPKPSQHAIVSPCSEGGGSSGHQPEVGAGGGDSDGREQRAHLAGERQAVAQDEIVSQAREVRAVAPVERRASSRNQRSGTQRIVLPTTAAQQGGGAARVPPSPLDQRRVRVRVTEHRRDPLLHSRGKFRWRGDGIDRPGWATTAEGLRLARPRRG